MWLVLTFMKGQGGIWPFAPSTKNIWHNAPISKLNRDVPLFRYSISVKPSSINNSTMKKPSSAWLLGNKIFSRYCLLLVNVETELYAE